ncbi:hypothetical protein Tco_1459722, partial [Tanacetum coccineum]
MKMKYYRLFVDDDVEQVVKSLDGISLRRGYCDNCALSRLCAIFYQVAEHQ